MKNKDKTKRNEEIKKLSNTLTPQQIAKELSISIITVKKVLSSQLNEQVKEVKETSNANTKTEVTREFYTKEEVDNLIKEINNLIAKVDKEYADYFSILQKRLDELYIKPIEKSDFGFPPELLILKDTKSLTSSQVKDILICGISIMPNRFTLGMLVQRVSIFKALTNEIIEEAMENQESVYRKENTYIKI